MKRYDKKICVIGMGYIGLPTAALLAKSGYTVFGVDTNNYVVETVNCGQTHFEEDGLNALVKETVRSGSLKALNVPNIADIYIICVPTPFDHSESLPVPDLSYIESALKSIIPLIKDDDMIILESTSPVGTTLKLADQIRKSRKDNGRLSIAYCPERVLPGNIIHELIINDRIIGGVDTDSSENIANFYRTFVSGAVHTTNSNTAEMCKLAENSYRDVNIAFANELSVISSKYDINVNELINLANKHPRVDILQPGIGVGGHCIAVDPWFIVADNKDDSPLIRQARNVNDSKPDWVMNAIMREIQIIKEETKTSPRVTCFGLSFKPDVDDYRGSPAITIVDKLIQNDIDVSIVEPNKCDIEKYKFINNKDALKSDLIIFLVKHTEFCDSKFKNKFSKNRVLDFCGIYN